MTSKSLRYCLALLAVFFGVKASTVAQGVSVTVMPVQERVTQYEPVYIGIRIKNEEKLQVRLVTNPYKNVEIERRVGLAWVNINEEKATLTGIVTGGQPFYTVQPGETLWMQYR